MPKPNSSERVARPAPDDDRGWLGLVLDHQPIPALVVDLETFRVILENEAARSIPLDFDPVETVDNPVVCLAADAGGQIALDRLGAYLTTHAAVPGGVEISWKASGRAYNFRVYSRDLPPADGQAAWSVLTFVDVTEQAEAEAELRRALEIRDEFFSIATHELKDPLFSLQLSIQLVRHTATRQGELPSYIVHHLDVSQRQAERLSRLIDNLLDVSRIMNRRLQLDIEALDLGELAREVTTRFRERALSDGTSIETEAPGPVIGYFDRLKLEQVLGNLISNALKYGAGRPVAVRVRADDATAVVEVEDQGNGIAPEDQARIFGRFERASDGHKKESLGLGLYIVRSLVEAHGGTIGVRSATGRGSTFAVTLPRKRLSHIGEGSEPADAGAGPPRG